MVERQLPKLHTRVRFPSPAPVFHVEHSFEPYIALLAKWGSTISLSARGQRGIGAIREHIDNSLEIRPYLPETLDRFVDLGSGQGFPAIPLALVTGAFVDMIEADRRKSAFLTTALAELRLAGRVHVGRIESTVIQPANVVTARALAPLDRLIEFAAPFATRPGLGLFLKGESVLAELASLRPDPTRVVELLPTAQQKSALVRVTFLR
jgi:16S rRNA (guanine527-N7)-methyltransferase